MPEKLRRLLAKVMPKVNNDITHKTHDITIIITHGEKDVK
jgi:hypothetical protein